MKARRKTEGQDDTEQGVKRINISLTPTTHEIGKCLAKKRYGRRNKFSPLVEELIIREAKRHKLAAA